MTVTDKERAVLVHLSDGEWRVGADLARSPVTLGALVRKGLIREAGDSIGWLLGEYFTITPDGEHALRVTA